MYNRRSFIIGAASLATPAVITRANAGVIQMKVGHNNTMTSVAQSAAVAFADFLRERGEGRFDVEVYPLSMLGNEVQMARGLVDGSMEACVSANGVLGSYADEPPLIEYPYLFQSLAHARSSLDGKMGAHIASKLEKKGVLVIGWGENGLRHISARRPVRTPADLKGLKLRVQPIKMHIEAFVGLGAAAAPMVWTQLPSAMRAGQFDAQENPLTNVAANEFLLEMQTHVSLTGHVYSPYPLVFSKAAWNRLNSKSRDLVMEAAQKAVAASRLYTDKGTEAAVTTLKQRNLAVVTDVDVPAFQRAVEALQPSIARHINSEAFKEIRNLVA
jgi:tripartite ATP-independent transporter DctP family solute receptor